jgi:hypothetical protein
MEIRTFPFKNGGATSIPIRGKGNNDKKSGDIPANWNDIHANWNDVSGDDAYQPVVKSNKFTDVTGRYVEIVTLLTGLGVIQGKSDTNFRAYDPLTRDQLAYLTI